MPESLHERACGVRGRQCRRAAWGEQSYDDAQAMPGQQQVLVWGAAIAMVLAAALLDALTRAHRLRKRRTLDDLAALSWQQSEEVIADAFRRHRYVHGNVLPGIADEVRPVDGGAIADTTAQQIDPSARRLTQKPAAPIDG